MKKSQAARAIWIMILVILAVALAMSCESDLNLASSAEKVTPPSPESLDEARAKALKNRTQKAVFNANEGVAFTSEKGARLYIPSSCLYLEGDRVKGEVELSFVELYDRKDMVTTHKPLMGINPNGEKQPLITGGAFYIHITKDGKQLENYCGISLDVPSAWTGGDDSDMILWEGAIDENGDLSWKDMIENMEGDIKGFGLAIDDGYSAFFNSFGWINIGRFWDDDRPKTEMRVKVPEGFDYQNSAVYLSYEGEAQALVQLDSDDQDGKYFTEHYGYVPIGLAVHLIFATVEGDRWRYAIKTVTIEADKTYEFLLSDTKMVTEEEFSKILKELP